MPPLFCFCNITTLPKHAYKQRVFAQTPNQSLVVRAWRCYVSTLRIDDMIPDARRWNRKKDERVGKMNLTAISGIQTDKSRVLFVRRDCMPNKGPDVFFIPLHLEFTWFQITKPSRVSSTVPLLPAPTRSQLECHSSYPHAWTTRGRTASLEQRTFDPLAWQWRCM